MADDPAEGLGPLDLAAAVRAETDTQAERSLLETRHFVAGHARAWRDPSSVAYAAVYEFGSPADAAAYLVDGFVTLESRGARVYDVPTPTGGRGFSQGAERDIAHGVAFVRGARFFLVIESGSGRTAPAADGAAALARAVEQLAGERGGQHERDAPS